MNVTDFSITSGYLVRFTVSLERAEFRPFLQQAAAKRSGKDIYRAAAKAAADHCVAAVCTEREVDPVSLPEVNILRADDLGFVCLAELQCYPAVDHMEYRGLKAEKPVRKCREEDIDAEINRFLRQRLYVHEVPREARMGDIAEVDFTGTHHGGPFPYDHSSKSRFILGSGQLFAGLDEALLGHKAGDHLELSLTMPEEFHRSDVAGMTLDLRVNLHGVWARDLRELNDAFVKKFVDGAETVEEYRSQTRETLQKRFDERTERIFQGNLNRALAEALPLGALPPAMVETTLRRYVDTLAAIAAQEELDVAQYLAREGKTLEDYKTMAEPAAREQTAVSIALDYIIRSEGLSVDPARMDRYIRRYAKANGISVEEAAGRIDRDAVTDEMLQRDAMQLVRDAAIPTEMQVDELPPER